MWRVRAQAAAATVLAVVALCAVSLMSEEGLDTVRESHAMAKATRSTSQQPQDHSQQKVADQLTKLSNREHEGNKAARHELRNVAAAGTQALLKTELASLERRASQKVQEAAKAAAVKEARKHSTLPSAALSVTAEKKLALLRHDDEVLKAAVKKGQATSDQKRAAAASEAKKFQLIVKGKLSEAKDHFATLKKQLTAYKGTNKTKKKAQKELELLKRSISHVTDRIAAKKTRLHRTVARQQEQVHHFKQKVGKSEAKLQTLLVHYKKNLKGLNSKLAVVNKATDINKALGTRINAARDVLKKQENKITELKAKLKHMTADLHETKQKTTAFELKAAKRKHDLHVAHGQYKALSQEIADLNKKAKQGAAKVEVQVPRGNSATQTNKAIQKLTRAVSKASGGKKAKAALLKKMIQQASSAAVKETKKRFKPPTDIKVPGLDQALSSVAKMTQGLDLEAEDVEALQTNAVKTTEVHKAELLAHVAHTLYKRAMNTDKASDKVAARAAMKKAMEAHNALHV